MKKNINIPNKIANLIYLKKYFDVPKFLFFTSLEYKKNKNKILDNISRKFKVIIIRSAFSGEDNSGYSNAGKFLSIPNLNSKKREKIDISIQEVLNSYNIKDVSNQYFIIQEMITKVNRSGVIFARDQKKGVPYVKINFSLQNKTDSITSGKTNGKLIYYILNKKNLLNDQINKKLHKIIIKLIKHINPFDLEFCIDENNKIFLLQIRKLNLKVSRNNKNNYLNSLEKFEKKLNKLINISSPTVSGNFTLFSTMPDWNPAEMIGIKPHNLAMSLYKTLITDDIWAKSRHMMGYKNVENTPLMYEFLGTPYIDLRADLNSFIPKRISSKDSNKLINFYLKKFKRKPDYFFDKIESELVLHTYDFEINNRLRKIKKLFTNNSISIFKKELRNLTINTIRNINQDIDKYKKINSHLNNLKKSKLYSFNKIQEMIKICKNFGTLPFANLARCGFIAVEFLNSMIKQKIIDKKTKEQLMQSIPSITKEMNNDLLSLPKSKFLKRYGHLRPYTYDIDSKNYSDAYNDYFKLNNSKKFNIKKFKINNQIKINIAKSLKKHQLKIQPDELINFIKLSIEHRERAKFEFTKIVNEIFIEIDKISKRFQIKKEDRKFINILEITKLYSEFNHKNIKSYLHQLIKKNKKDYYFNNEIELPNNILTSNDIFYYEEKTNSPTYVTNLTTLGEIVLLNEMNLKKNLENKIVCIYNADPGFDFIFTKKIKGLVTMYGGPNSHMSIRCSELNIPAIIGIGQQLFEEIRKNKKILIDAKQKKIELL